MRDLIYAGVQDIIKKKYPTAVFIDASDCVHEDRFEVEVIDIESDDWWKFCVESGIAYCSLGFRLRLGSNKKFIEKVKVWSKDTK